jgi:hypothetical protein
MEMMSMDTLNTSARVTADSPKGQRAIETFRAQYNKAGLNDERAQILNEHPGFAAFLADGIRRFSRKTVDYVLARSILGADFITPEEVTSARPRIVYSVEQTKALAESLPSEDVLKWCKENGYAVLPAPPTAMSTRDVREIRRVHFCGGWYVEHKLAREDKTSFGWLLIKKTRVSNSTRTTWNEQKRLLSALEKVPNVAEMSWFITTYFEVRGTRLFEGVYVRTSTLDSFGQHVLVGLFDSAGLRVDEDWDGDRNDLIGLSAARK